MGTHGLGESLKLHVNTFCGDLQLAALGNLDRLDGLVARRCLGVLDLLHDLVALKNLAEDDVAAVEPSVSPTLAGWRRGDGKDRRGEGARYGTSVRSDDRGDEELRAIGVLAGVGHGEGTLLGVLELEVLVGELVAVD